MLDMAAFSTLAVRDISDPLGVKGMHVPEIHGGVRSDLTVSGIPQPLPMRTVGRHAAVKVRGLGVLISFHNPVDHGIGSLKASDGFHIGVDDIAAHNPGLPFHFEISEAMKTEARGVDLIGLPV